tara:strand:- start:1652 stop:1861 length:210 start_codon:yes stop_codon:yes gene_type:complete
LAAGRGIWTASSPPLAGKIGTGPRHIGSKTAEIRHFSAIFAPPPTPWLARAWAMFLSNIHMKNGIECFT